MRSEIIFKHRFSNFMHSLLLIGAMLVLFALMGWFIAGTSGLIILTVFGVTLSMLTAKISPAIVLRAYRARPLSYEEAPELTTLVRDLAQRAGLATVPRLYYIPSRMVNAFSVGQQENAAIGVTDGILRNLNLRELAGVLAHEISHIRHNDLRVMGLADMLNRTTSMFSLFGQILLFVNLPLILYSGYQIPWLFILLLIFAPTVSSLMQLGLSRMREYDADLEAARLTGDPRGLASALVKLEKLEMGFWGRIFLPGRKIPEPSLLRTHPHTEDRVRRLLELEGELEAKKPLVQQEANWGETSGWPVRVVRAPRWHYSGLWY